METILKSLLERETTGINHTYEVKLTLRNVSPNQIDKLGLIVDILETSGEVDVKKFDIQND